MADPDRARRLLPFAVVGLFALVAVVGLVSKQAGWFRPAADYHALCEAECACTGCIVDDCVANYERLAERQGECRTEGDALVECKLRSGGAECQSSGGWTLYMPVGPCVAAAKQLGDCLATH